MLKSKFYTKYVAGYKKCKSGDTEHCHRYDEHLTNCLQLCCWYHIHIVALIPYFIWLLTYPAAWPLVIDNSDGLTQCLIQHLQKNCKYFLQLLLRFTRIVSLCHCPIYCTKGSAILLNRKRATMAVNKTAIW